MNGKGEITIDDEKIKDFRVKGWGWSIESWAYKKNDKDIIIGASVIGIGENVLKGDFILNRFSGDNENHVWKVDEINYSDNPRDMFHADLAYLGVEA